MTEYHCPGLFIGDQDAAKNVRFLKHLRITHVLNTAEGQDENLVDLSAAHYEGTGIEYKVHTLRLQVKSIDLIEVKKQIISQNNWKLRVRAF